MIMVKIKSVIEWWVEDRVMIINLLGIDIAKYFWLCRKLYRFRLEFAQYFLNALNVNV